jgi:opacity protein-like surface antigen
MTKFVFSAGVALLLFAHSSLAGADAPPAPTRFRDASTKPFDKGSLSVENVTGVYYFFDRGGNDGATLDFAINSLRLGVMLSNPHGSGFFAGNSEFLGEVFGGGIFQGAGNVLAGGTLIIRYNFFRPGARVIPYFQIGGGGVYTDISQTGSKGLVSLPLEFNLQGGGGLRFLINRNWSILVEAGYRHISNASIKLPNGGVDNFGGDLGFAYSF